MHCVFDEIKLIIVILFFAASLTKQDKNLAKLKEIQQFAIVKTSLSLQYANKDKQIKKSWI